VRTSYALGTSGAADEADGGGGKGRGCRVSGATTAADTLPDDDDDGACAVLGAGCVVAAADGGPARVLAPLSLFALAGPGRVFFADAVGGCCAACASSSSSCRGWEEGAVLSERAAMSSAIPSGVSADGGDTGGPWLVAVAVVVAVASAFGALVPMRGMST